MNNKLFHLYILLLCWPLMVVGQGSSLQLPPSINLSQSKHFPPLINQQGDSCAQASGIGYLFTYEMNRLRDTDVSAAPDNRFSYLYAWNMINEGEDQGDFVPQGLYWVLRTGMMIESDYGPSEYHVNKWTSGYDR